jgi:hypothetical protein
MIEALEPTLALFVPPEKPQLSPALAASFIRNGRHAAIFRAAGCTDAIDDAGADGLPGLDLCPFLLAFYDDLTPRRGRAAFDRQGAPAVPPA